MATKLRLICLTALLACTVAAPASAQSIVDGYSPPGGSEQNDVAPSGDTKVDDTGQVKGAVETDPIAADDGVNDDAASGSPSSGGSDDTPSAPSANGGTADVSGSSLPFTGLDARLILMGGLLLALIGFATRRIAARIE